MRPSDPRIVLVPNLMKNLSLIVVVFVAFVTQVSVFGQLTVGATLFHSGLRAYESGRYDEAEQLFRQVVVELEKVPDSAAPKKTGLMVETLNALG